jgi:hypothetical protein
MSIAQTLTAVLAVHAGEKSSQAVTPSATFIPRGDTTANFNYVHAPEDGSRPYHYGFMAPPEGTPVTNFGFDSEKVPVTDLRGKEAEATLDIESFKYINGFPETTADFTSKESIKALYCPQVEKALLDHVSGAKKVIVFDHIVRHSANAKTNTIRPAYFAHIDQTQSSAEEFVNRYAGEEAATLLKGRYRFINFWKALEGPVNNTPLAFASSATVSDDDLTPFLHYFKDKPDEEIDCLKYREEHKWFYFSGMDTNEAILLQLFDSEAAVEGSGVKGGRAPHSAFRDPRTPEDAPARYSIEVRVIVFGE